MNLKFSLVSIFLAGLLAAAPCRADTAAPEAERYRALENLRISEEAAARIRRRLEALRLDPDSSPQEIATYEQYLARIEAQLEEHRRLAETLKVPRPSRESGKGRKQPSTAARVPEFRAAPVTTERDDVRALDSRLDDSLSAFDEKLLQEVETVSEEESASGSGSAGSSAGATTDGLAGSGEGQAEGAGGEGSTGARRSASTGGATTASGSGPATGAGGEPGDRTGTASRGGRPGGEGDKQASAGSGTGGSRPGTPAGIPDGRDDDIVARQIREAAEKETDPELREKLWEEYRRYKSGAG